MASGTLRADRHIREVPERCTFAREREFPGEDLRQAIFQSQRVVFEVKKTDRRVYVVFVRHAKRLAIGDPGGDQVDD